MKKSTMAIAVIAIVVIVAGVIFATGMNSASNNAYNSNQQQNLNANQQPQTNTNSAAQQQTNTNTQPAQSTDTSQQPAQNSGVKFSDSPYYNYAFLISGDTVSPDAQQAMDGFTMTKTAQADGTTRYDLTTTKNGYKNQSYTLKPGQSLYFIETNMEEDQPGYDGSLGDDGAVIVDSNGYLVQ